MSLADKIAEQYILGGIVQDGQTVEGHLQELSRWKDQLVAQKDIIDVLWLKGLKRSVNAPGVPVPDPKPVLQGGMITAVKAQVKSSTEGYYDTQITFLPKRSHRCSCPDWKKRAKSIGPCKHVLALGEAWEARVEKALKGMITDLPLVLAGILDSIS